jgi:uncharacterized protein YqgC (DUF456 family)
MEVHACPMNLTQVLYATVLPAIPVICLILKGSVLFLKFYKGFTCEIIVTKTISTKSISNIATTMDNIQFQTKNLKKGLIFGIFQNRLNFNLLFCSFRRRNNR